MGASHDQYNDCHDEFVILNVLLTSWMSHDFQWIEGAERNVHVCVDTTREVHLTATHVVLYSTGVVEMSRDTDICMCVFLLLYLCCSIIV